MTYRNTRHISRHGLKIMQRRRVVHQEQINDQIQNGQSDTESTAQPTQQDVLPVPVEGARGWARAQEALQEVRRAHGGGGGWGHVG